ncbi:hypothetical protein HRH25_23555 [Flavisolibacter sp. BT320]|nr:hypothetical protein [Flavisolibacter longurius]
MNDKAMKFIRSLLIGWFIIINLIIIIWSIVLPFSLKKVAEKDPPSEIPQPPAIVQLDSVLEKAKNQVAFYTQQVETYKKQVEAYNSQQTSYNKYLDTNSKDNQLDAYKAVAKDTLSPLITGLIASLFAFAFAKTGLEVLNNYVAVKNGQPPQPLSKFF